MGRATYEASECRERREKSVYTVIKVANCILLLFYYLVVIRLTLLTSSLRMSSTMLRARLFKC